MPGPAPKRNRVRRNPPMSGEWKVAPGVGWQHGAVPDPPDGLVEESRVAWTVWMGSWFASFWLPADLPGLRQIVRLYDQVERGEFQRAGELRMEMAAYGMSPEGQQRRHWLPAESEGGGEVRQLRAVAGTRMLAVDSDT